MSNMAKPSFDLKGALETDIETIHILDVGAMLEGEARYAALLEKGLAEVIGFEPNPLELARLRQEGAANCTWLPYFLGDGGEATFHLTHYPGCSSLYTPDPGVIDLFHTIGTVGPSANFGVVDTETVQTKRLDDVEECPPIDFVKIDVRFRPNGSTMWKNARPRGRTGHPSSRCGNAGQRISHPAGGGVRSCL